MKATAVTEYTKALVAELLATRSQKQLSEQLQVGQPQVSRAKRSGQLGVRALWVAASLAGRPATEVGALLSALPSDPDAHGDPSVSELSAIVAASKAETAPAERPDAELAKAYAMLAEAHQTIAALATALAERGRLRPRIL